MRCSIEFLTTLPNYCFPTQLIGALESKVKHAQCFDVAHMRDGSIVLASKDYRLYIYRYVKVMEAQRGHSLALCRLECTTVISGPRHRYVKDESQFRDLVQGLRVVP